MGRALQGSSGVVGDREKQMAAVWKGLNTRSTIFVYWSRLVCLGAHSVICAKAGVLIPSILPCPPSPHPQGISREEFIAGVARDIQTKIPEPFDMPLLRKEIGVPSPTQVVLLQEVERWNSVLAVMTSSLRDLQRALTGEIGFSSSLEDLSNSIFNGKVPAMWARLNPATEKSLGSWMLWFQRRYKQYKAWCEHGEPRVMWLSGLHIPETYLAALVQSACRDKGWPLDKSTLYTRVTRFTEEGQITEKPKYGCYVTGLYLEGAGWDVERSMLRKQDPKMLVTELPILQIIPIEANKLKLANTFKSPVYVTQARRNAMGVGLVFEADISTNEHPSLWTLQGVALILNTS